jgi:hypothetical protein
MSNDVRGGDKHYTRTFPITPDPAMREGNTSHGAAPEAECRTPAPALAAGDGTEVAPIFPGARSAGPTRSGMNQKPGSS